MSAAGTNCMFGQSIFATESHKIQAVQHEKAKMYCFANI